MSEAMQKKTVTIQLFRGLSGRPRRQRSTVYGLGLKKIGQVRTLEATAPILGMINKVIHLVRVVDHGA